MIGRILLYTIIALLGVFVLAATETFAVIQVKNPMFLLEHGSGFTSARPPISIHDLRLLPESYRDRTVTTEGTLHYSADLDQYEVVDADQQAVVLLGYNETLLRTMLGKTVTVTGRFDVNEAAGIYIDVESIGITQ